MDSGSAIISPKFWESHPKPKLTGRGQVLPYLVTDLGLDILLLELAFTLSGLKITLLEGEKQSALKIMPLPLTCGG